MMHGRIKLFIVITMAISVVSLILSLRISRSNEVKENLEKAKSFRILQGKIVALKRYRAIYTYKLNNQVMVDSIMGLPCNPEIDYFDRDQVETDLIGFTFPVFVSSLDSTFFMPAIMPHNFEYYGMEMPDSLEYVYQKYLNCNLWK